MTERSIWILLFTPSPIMSAMSTISTAIISRVLPPRVFLSPNYFPLSRFRPETLLSEHSAPFDRKKFHPRTKLLANNVCLFSFFFITRHLRVKDDWYRFEILENFWRSFGRDLIEGFPNRYYRPIFLSFFKFEAIKVIEENVK